MTPDPWMPEPWRWTTFDRPSRQHEGMDAVVIGGQEAVRAFACVNALAGIADPAAFVAAARAVKEDIYDYDSPLATRSDKDDCLACLIDHARKLAALLEKP